MTEDTTNNRQNAFWKHLEDKWLFPNTPVIQFTRTADTETKAKEIAEAINRKIRIEGLTNEELTNTFAQSGVPESVVIKLIDQNLRQQFLGVLLYDQNIPPAEDAVFEEIKPLGLDEHKGD